MHLNEILERHLLADKSSKKNKFESLNIESQDMIKNSSSEFTEFSATGATESLEELLNYSIIAKAVASLNHKLHLKGCKVVILLTFVTFFNLGDWIIRNSTDPDKTSLLFLGGHKNGLKFN